MASRKITFTPVGGSLQEVEIGTSSSLTITVEDKDTQHSIKVVDPITDDTVEFVGSRDKNKRD